MKNTSRKPYIYKVTNLETGQYYIGSQCSGKVVGVNYFTSSHNKEFKKEFKTYGEEKYEITIIKEFDDPDECVRVENYMIRDHMLLKDGLCLNRACHCNGEKIFSTVGQSPWNKGQSAWNKGLKGQSAWNKGKHLTEDARKKISEARKGIPVSEETRKKMSEAHKGHPSPNRMKISIEGEVFDSLTVAAKYYNVTKHAIRNWVKTNKHNTVYVEKCPKI